VRARRIFAVAALLALPGVARAQITEEPPPPFPDPAKFAHGFYTDGEIGAVTFVGKAGDKLGTGIALGARLGYDLLRFVALQLHVLGSTHQGSFPGTPENDQLLQVYQGTAELKLTFTLRQLSIYGYGAGGLARMSSNLLATAGLMGSPGQNPATVSQNSTVIGGGGGLDWHTLNRHFSLGLNVGYVQLADVSASGALATTVYLRYTF
jgi:hypothetical protein